MLLHLVLFRPRPNVTEAERQQMFDAIATAATGIPAVRRFQIGTRVKHGAGYETMSAEDFPYAALVELDDMDGLRSYLQHPHHQKLGILFYQLLEAGLVYDYEVIEAVTLRGTNPGAGQVEHPSGC